MSNHKESHMSNVGEISTIPVPAEMELHQFCTMFPALSGKGVPQESAQQFEELKADLRANGQQFPIIIFEEKILDGRNRWLALKAIGASEMKIAQFEGDESDALAFTVSANLIRRQLTTGQKATLGVEIEKQFSAMAAKKKSSGKGPDGSGGRGKKSAKPESSGTRSSARAAAVVGVGRNAIEHAKKLKAKYPEIAAKVADGSMTIEESKRAILRMEAQEVTIKDDNGTVVETDKLRLVFDDNSYDSVEMSPYSKLSKGEEVFTRGDLASARKVLMKTLTYVIESAERQRDSKNIPVSINVLDGLDLAEASQLKKRLSVLLRDAMPSIIFPEGCENKNAKSRGWLTEGERKLHLKAGKPSGGPDDDGDESDKKPAKKASVKKRK